MLSQSRHFKPEISEVEFVKKLTEIRINFELTFKQEISLLCPASSTHLSCFKSKIRITLPKTEKLYIAYIHQYTFLSRVNVFNSIKCFQMPETIVISEIDKS